MFSNAAHLRIDCLPLVSDSILFVIWGRLVSWDSYRLLFLAQYFFLRILGYHQNERDIKMPLKSKKQESGFRQVGELAEQKKTRIWDDDPRNPYNWPTVWKVHQVLMVASAAFTT